MVHTAVLSTSIVILAIIAYGDVRTRRIPNVLAFSIAALGLLRMIFDVDLMTAIHTIEASAAVFAVAFVLFWRGMRRRLDGETTASEDRKRQADLGG
jgi:Flp pilus assembly protein protease CpaA